MPRTAGRKVRRRTPTRATTIAPPIPIERRPGASNSSRPDRPIATASPRRRRPCRPSRRRARRPADRPAACELLAEAADDEQRVVDREREPEHRRDVQDVDAHLGLLGDEVDERRATSGSRGRRRAAACRPRSASRRRGSGRAPRSAARRSRRGGGPSRTARPSPGSAARSRSSWQPVAGRAGDEARAARRVSTDSSSVTSSSMRTYAASPSVLMKRRSPVCA